MMGQKQFLVTSFLVLGVIVGLYQACGRLPGGGDSGVNPQTSKSLTGGGSTGGGGTTTDNPLVARVAMKIMRGQTSAPDVEASFCITGVSTVNKDGVRETSKIAPNESGTPELKSLETRRSLSVPSIPSVTVPTVTVPTVTVPTVTVPSVSIPSIPSMPGLPSLPDLQQFETQLNAQMQALMANMYSMSFQWYGNVSYNPSQFGDHEFSTGSYEEMVLHLGPECESGHSVELANKNGRFSSKAKIDILFIGNARIPPEGGAITFDASAQFSRLGEVTAAEFIPAVLMTSKGVFLF